MKIRFLLLSIVFFAIGMNAQVTTSPSMLTESATSFTITFNAAGGNAGMSGSTAARMHIGAITSKSTSDSDWKYVNGAGGDPTWITGDIAMSFTGANKFTKKINSSLRDFFGITDPTEKVLKLAMVFNDGKQGGKEGKSASNGDIFVTVYEAGLNVGFVSAPDENSIVSSGTKFVSAQSTVAANLKMYKDDVNTTPIATANNATLISSSLSLTEGNYKLIVTAELNGETKTATRYFCCTTSTSPTQTCPAGLKNGITTNASGQAQFRVYAPGKNYIMFLSDLNDFRPDVNCKMYKDGDYFWYTLTGLDANKEYRFQYLVDGTIHTTDMYCHKILDPYNDKYINYANNRYPESEMIYPDNAQGVVGCFKCVEPTYNWQVTNFTAPGKESLMIYECLVRDFRIKEYGYFRQLIDNFDYIKNLGINALQLMPVNEFDGNNSWGYNTNFYFAPDKAYGTADDLKELIDLCHQNGIAVILDVVFNHTWGLSPTCMMWWDATNGRPAANNPYHNPVAPHPYSVGNDINHSAACTKEWINNVLEYWLTEYKVDGYRFDLTKGFTQNASTESTASNYDADRIAILESYGNKVHSVNPNAYFIIEHFCDNSEESKLISDVNAMPWRKMTEPYQEMGMGWASAKVNIDGSYTSNYVAFGNSHDEERIAYKAAQYGNGAIKTVVANRSAQMATTHAFLSMVPGPKMMWMWEEYGWDEASGNGDTEAKNPHLEYLDDSNRAKQVANYGKINLLRKVCPELFSMTADYAKTFNGSSFNSGEFITLSSGGKKVIAVGNFNNLALTVSVPFTSGTWYDYMEGDQTGTSISGAQSKSIPANSVKLYTNFKVDVSAVEDIEEDITAQVNIYPNPATDVVSVSVPVSVAYVYSQDGKLMMQASDANINVSSLSQGAYILKAVTDNGVVVRQFVKK